MNTQIISQDGLYSEYRIVTLGVQLNIIKRHFNIFRLLIFCAPPHDHVLAFGAGH